MSSDWSAPNHASHLPTPFPPDHNGASDSAEPIGSAQIRPSDSVEPRGPQPEFLHCLRGPPRRAIRPVKPILNWRHVPSQNCECDSSQLFRQCSGRCKSFGRVGSCLHKVDRREMDWWHRRRTHHPARIVSWWNRPTGLITPGHTMWMSPMLVSIGDAGSATRSGPADSTRRWLRPCLRACKSSSSAGPYAPAALGSCECPCRLPAGELQSCVSTCAY